MRSIFKGIGTSLWLLVAVAHADGKSSDRLLSNYKVGPREQSRETPHHLCARRIYDVRNSNGQLKYLLVGYQLTQVGDKKIEYRGLSHFFMVPTEEALSDSEALEKADLVGIPLGVRVRSHARKWGYTIYDSKRYVLYTNFTYGTAELILQPEFGGKLTYSESESNRSLNFKIDKDPRRNSTVIDIDPQSPHSCIIL